MAQKTILQLAQTIASELSVPSPQTVVSSSDPNIQKIKALIIATCDDLLNESNWQFLQSVALITTAAGVDNYAFPTDIDRFVAGSFFNQNTKWPMQGPLTASEWALVKLSNLAASPFTKYRVVKGRVYLFPTPSDSLTKLQYEYVSNAYVQNGNTGVNQSDFTQDSDICLFDHRVVVYGTKLKWLASLNLDTTAAFVDYNHALQFAKGTNTPDRRLNLAGRTVGNRLITTANIPDTGFGA